LNDAVDARVRTRDARGGAPRDHRLHPTRVDREAIATELEDEQVAMHAGLSRLLVACTVSLFVYEDVQIRLGCVSQRLSFNHN
jgi:hypothetical protein